MPKLVFKKLSRELNIVVKIVIIIKITISSIVIGFKKLLFSTYSLSKLLSDSLFSDSL